jgi:hypothetical protein
MNVSSLAAALPIDRRQSPAALAIGCGVTRLLHGLGYAIISELSLASGRRADLVGLGARGEIWIVEIKSSVADMRADHKWMDYRAHCDRLFFATSIHVPATIFPSDAGLILADAIGGSIVSEAPRHQLHPATRKTVMLAFARTAALRLANIVDPQGSMAVEQW